MCLDYYTADSDQNYNKADHSDYTAAVAANTAHCYHKPDPPE